MVRVKPYRSEDAFDGEYYPKKRKGERDADEQVVFDHDGNRSLGDRRCINRRASGQLRWDDRLHHRDQWN